MKGAERGRNRVAHTPQRHKKTTEKNQNGDAESPTSVGWAQRRPVCLSVQMLDVREPELPQTVWCG